MSWRVEKHKPKRVTVACDNCRRRKIRCDSLKPACGRCSELGYKCVYSPSERQLASDSRFSVIHERLDHVDDVIYSLKSDMETVISSLSTVLARNSSRSKSDLSGEIKLPEKEYVSEHQMNEAPLFNDRLAHLKVHTNGDQINTTVYLSSVFLSILSPKDISGLSYILGDQQLPQRLEKVSYNVWCKTQDAYGRLMSPSNNANGFRPDVALIQAGINSFKSEGNEYLYPLLPPEDIDLVKWAALPEPLSNGLKAAFIIIGSFDMRIKSNYLGFSKSLVDAQERAAYFQAIRTLNLMRFSCPTFLSVRIAILLSLFLIVFSNLPGMFNLLDPVVEMCKAIKLDSLEAQRSYPREIAEWRSKVWFLGSNLMYCYYVTLSVKPLGPKFTFDDLSLISLNRPELKEQTKMLSCAIRIHEIYDLAYEKLFSVPSSKFSSDELLGNVVYLGEQISAWESDFSWNSQNIPVLDSFGSFISMFALGNLNYKFLHTVIVIYSIPAFNPGCLPERVPGALSKVSNAARELYKIALISEDIKSECTSVNSIAVTAAICTLLYKQLCYPMHPSNHEDLKTLKNGIHRLDQVRWPLVNSQSPQSEIWSVLLDVMDHHYRLHNEPVDQITQGIEKAADVWDNLITRKYVEGSDQCTVI